MDFTASHTGFVVAAYIATFLGLAALVAFILLRDLRLKRQLARLDRDKMRAP